MSELMSLVSKMYPRGLQLRNRSRVSNVDLTNTTLEEFSYKEGNRAEAWKDWNKIAERFRT
jgi:hypothetical protein